MQCHANVLDTKSTTYTSQQKQDKLRKVKEEDRKKGESKVEGVHGNMSAIFVVSVPPVVVFALA